MDGGLAPDIIASIVKKVQIRILMNLEPFLADGIWWNTGNKYYVLGGGGSVNGLHCGGSSLDLNNPAANANWYVGASLSY